MTITCPSLRARFGRRTYSRELLGKLFVAVPKYGYGFVPGYDSRFEGRKNVECLPIRNEEKHRRFHWCLLCALHAGLMCGGLLVSIAALIAG